MKKKKKFHFAEEITQMIQIQIQLIAVLVDSRLLTVAGIPSPADAHFLIHCCRVSIPFCSMPFAMLAPSVTRPIGASTTAVTLARTQDTVQES